MQHVITDDLEALLAALPPDIHNAVNRLENRSELLEIVMDLGRLPEGRFPEGEVILSTTPVTYADLEYVVERIGNSVTITGLVLSGHSIVLVRCVIAKGELSA